jgi:putative chitinase
MMTVEQFAAAVPCSHLTAATWHQHIETAMQTHRIRTLPHAAAFLAQMSHESGCFSRFEENLNYSADGLARTWPNRYAVNPKAAVKVPNSLARSLHRRPQAIANLTYANRGGNGPEASGDGWKYRGRGPKQITLKSNYLAYFAAAGLPTDADPDLLLQEHYGADAAGWFWESNRLGRFVDSGDDAGLSRAINGGLIGHEDGNDVGVDDRVEHLALARRVLGVAT